MSLSPVPPQSGIVTIATRAAVSAPRPVENSLNLAWAKLGEASTGLAMMATNNFQTVALTTQGEFPLRKAEVNLNR
jgi:hypothetical protein